MTTGLASSGGQIVNIRYVYWAEAMAMATATATATDEEKPRGEAWSAGNGEMKPRGNGEEKSRGDRLRRRRFLNYILVQAAAYGVIIYTMIGFEWTATKLSWYLFFVFFTLLYSTYHGKMTAAMTPNHHIAQIVSAAFYGILNFFSGSSSHERMPIWWRWYHWACPVSWTMYGLLASQFGDIKDRLDRGETVEEFLRDYFGLKYDFLGLVAAMHVGFTLLFAAVFAVSNQKI